jgi:hypothetical protein
MSLRAEYRATLKCREVEEPIDLWLHRPIAFLLAKVAARTPVTPNQLTGVSLVIGVAGGATLVVNHPYAGLVAAALIFLSAVVDCADGMLARMTKRTSDLGRMLDGCADAVTGFAAVVGSLFVIFKLYPKPAYMPAVIVAVAYVTVRSSLLHTIAYDHYKNLFVRLTVPGTSDTEDLEQARVRYRQEKEQPQSLLLRGAWRVYLDYLKGQRQVIRWFDPHTVVRMGQLPAWSEAVAETYRRHALRLMQVWRSAFGVGSMVFGFALFNAFGRPDLFLGYRLILMNAVFFLYLMPAQRRASRQAFRELGVLREQAVPSPKPTDEPWATEAREKHA